MDEDAFLRAVLEHPDDDGPRLVYADWLEERGDPRGAFIRAQVELERLDPDDPRRPDLACRAERLLAEHRRGWLAPIDRLRGEIYGADVFRRGFVDTVTVSAHTFLHQGEALAAVTPL